MGEERVQPSNEDGFLDWFAGFVDGEGCFRFFLQQGYPCAVFKISLRADDNEVLSMMRERLRLGQIYYHKFRTHSRPQFTWKVQSREECKRLVEILDHHPLRTKKQRDYLIWRKAVLEFCKGRGKYNGQYLRELARELRQARMFNPIADPSAIATNSRSGRYKGATAFPKLHDREWLHAQKRERRPDHEIAAELGCCRTSVILARRALGIPARPTFPQLRDAEWLRAQKEAGKTDHEIALQVGCGKTTVWDARRRLGIPARPEL